MTRLGRVFWDWGADEPAWELDVLVDATEAGDAPVPVTELVPFDLVRYDSFYEEGPAGSWHVGDDGELPGYLGTCGTQVGTGMFVLGRHWFEDSGN